MDVSTFRAWIAEATRLVVDNTDHLTHLDAAVGDADHGINLRRGFEAAQAMLDETSPATPGAVLTTVGRALISKTGGASGPLYGTGFRQAGKTLGEDPDVSAIQLGTALAAALAGIRQLGAAAEGDKTMVDALIPAVDAYRAVVDIGLHDRSLSFDDAVAIYRDRIGMVPDAALGEACKSSMFPGTAVMYWLGTEAIHQLRRDREKLLAILPVPLLLIDKSQVRLVN